ncbi:response regulator transcription factor [Limisalsivibrio acetivorans]|uniref:response regulator transcription factor n=1 Tax=Limisalsivibrio acetivorans TaxID=1304888 RepID=UPI0003B71E59|nr:response regulator [Limisalsivibrio acetivorans]
MAFKVLIIDDSDMVRHFHANILKSAGFDADQAIDGMDALEKTTQNSYSLLLCDLNMPRMDGVTFIKEFRKTGKETPVIIITTQEEAENRKLGYTSGANLYITKPVKPDELIINIKMLLGIT